MHAETATDTDVAFVPATFELLPMLTVAENVALPVCLTGIEPDPVWIGAVLRVVELDGDGALRTLRRIAAELGIAVVLTADDAA
jgi:ABC-type lipoprotein export system ATPase subunit